MLTYDNELMPIYDNEESVRGIICNGTSYYFQKNLQGDVIELVDEEAEVVARYSYDAWGKVTGVKDKSGNAITDATHVANINPFRYRGYYFDTEIGLYYLQSRYYDPVVGRFVNADEAEFAVSREAVLKHNLFSYCVNEPIKHVDYSGHDGGVIEIAIIAIVIAVAYAVLCCVCYVLSRLVAAMLELLWEILTCLWNGIKSAAESLWLKIKIIASIIEITTVTSWNLINQFIADSLGCLTNVMTEVIAKARVAKQYAGMEAHHIVAETDGRAEVTRQFIEKYGLSVYGSYNIIPLKKTLHKHIHTNSYFAAVDFRLRLAAVIRNSTEGKREAIIAEIMYIGSILSVVNMLF